MLNIKIAENSGTQIETGGNLYDQGIELLGVISHIHSLVYRRVGPKQANAFRKLIQSGITDSDSPVWDVSEEDVPDGFEAVIPVKGDRHNG